MTIPLATTTVTIERQTAPTDAWPDDPPVYDVIATGVRAHFPATRISGTESGDGNVRSELNARLLTDPCDLQHLDRVTDETTGVVWEVSWVLDRSGDYFGLDDMHAGVRRVEAEVGAGT